MPCVKNVLTDAAGSLQSISDSAMLEAEILLSLALGADRSYLRAWPERTVQEPACQHFLALLKKRQEGVPIAYITGFREFWSKSFIVTPDVLIPRPETELLVELSLELIAPGAPFNIVDLGTGSGIIAICLATERPESTIVASDISAAALEVAQRNADRHEVAHIRFCLSDWFSMIPNERYSLIVSNPPYIAENDDHLCQGDVRFEPRSALCAKDAGLHAIASIADQARRYLEPGGHLLIEHGYNQESPVQALFRQFDYQNIKTFYDLSGQPRVSYGQKTSRTRRYDHHPPGNLIKFQPDVTFFSKQQT